MKLFSFLFKTKKTAKKSTVHRVRNTHNGKYARKVSINYMGQEVAHYYTNSDKQGTKYINEL